MTCKLQINGTTVQAAGGETLLEAGLAGRVAIPHDCAAGTCGTCRVTVLEGDVDAQGTRQRATVLACRARVVGDARIAFDPVPEVSRVRGLVEAIAPLSPGVLEVRIRTARRVVWLPGQYVKVAFKGFPARDYSPTFALDLAAEDDLLVLHVARRDGGVVSSALGGAIAVDHPATIEGPFGHAFLRRDEGSLLLVSTGTGFAPIWAIAVAARLGQPWRSVRVIAGARQRCDLYALATADWLAAQGVATVFTASDGDGRAIRRERPQRLLPTLGPTDTVHAAGSPSMVAAVEAAALVAGAAFEADVFTPAPAARPSVAARLGKLLTFGWRSGRPAVAPSLSDG